MCTRWYFNNLAEDATLSPSTENALFPATNIQDPRRTKVFRSLSNSSHVYFDFGAAEEIDSIVLVDHLLNGFGFTAATLELNSVPTWTSGAPVSIAVEIDQENGIAFGKHTSIVNYRYAKLLLTSSLGYCEVSKVFIGKEEVISSQVDFSYPLNFSRRNSSTIAKNRYNQAFVDVLPSFRQISGSIMTMTKDEVDVLLELDKICSIDRPFFIRFDEDEATLLNDNDVMAGYFRLSDELRFQLVAGGYWNCAGVSMEEAG